MIGVKRGIRSEEVRRRGGHVLFVEGKDGNSIDPNVLGELFDRSIHIEPLGPSYSVRSVAEALFSYHPTYYFLIDRDHHDDAFVERSWDNFPDPGKYNLLIWRRREIENYFLEPEYLFQSKFCRVDRNALERKILQCVDERLFLDAANHVVTSIREELKRNWIEKFSNPADFPDRETALRRLKNAGEFEAHREDVGQKTSVDEVERRFYECLEAMTGGQEKIAFGAGNWIGMIQGKKILAQIINSECFHVQAADGTLLAGKEKINEVVKELLRKDSEVQPSDFVALKKLIETRINGTA